MIKNSDGYKALEHFVGADKMISLGKDGLRKVLDYRLSRYACYLIVQNADPKKEVVAKNGGTMPEELPTPDKSLKELEKENKKLKIADCKYNIK